MILTMIMLSRRRLRLQPTSLFPATAIYWRFAAIRASGSETAAGSGG
jgi:hypothetical protein